jgi:hypothetical protein
MLAADFSKGTDLKLNRVTNQFESIHDSESKHKNLKLNGNAAILVKAWIIGRRPIGTRMKDGKKNQ